MTERTSVRGQAEEWLLNHVCSLTRGHEPRFFHIPRFTWFAVCDAIKDHPAFSIVEGEPVGFLYMGRQIFPYPKQENDPR